MIFVFVINSMIERARTLKGISYCISYLITKILSLFVCYLYKDNNSLFVKYRKKYLGYNRVL